MVKGYGSTYIVTLNFIASFVVAIVSLFERSSYIPPPETFDSIAVTRDADQESSESSPLLRRDPLPSEVEESIKRDKRFRDYRSGTTWIVKYLVFIPIPLIVCLWLLYAAILPAIGQTLPDAGNTGTTVYVIVGVFAVLAFFNLAPFFLSTSLVSALPSLLLLLIILTLTSILKAPFDVKAPLKVYFKQVIDFDSPANSHVVIEGIPRYMESAVSNLAFAQSGLNCTKGSTRSPRLNTCTFPAPVDPRLSKAGITTSFKRGKNGTTNRVLQVDTISSRICDITLDEPVNVLAINEHAVNTKESHFRMYRRDWDAPFQITLEAISKGIQGTVTCFWDDRTDNKIEAFEIVNAELPEWCEAVKRETGLVWFSRKLKL